jgi:hypothetical protein
VNKLLGPAPAPGAGPAQTAGASGPALPRRRLPAGAHCTALHCTALHCTALHCTALHCTALHCTVTGPGQRVQSGYSQATLARGDPQQDITNWPATSLIQDLNHLCQPGLGYKALKSVGHLAVSLNCTQFSEVPVPCS